MSTAVELLVGRDEVLSDLQVALARTATGVGGCIVLEGPTGIGKSRLLESVAAEAGLRGLSVATGQAVELDLGTPLASLLRVLRSLGPELAADTAVDITASGLRQMDQLRAALEDYVRHRQLVVLVDDAHLADELTALVLRILVPALSSLPVLWVLARRPGPVRGAAQTMQETIDWLLGEGARRVLLDPLKDEAVAVLCANTLGVAPDRTVLSLAARCEGNPFLLRELLTALRETGQLRVDGERATVVETIGVEADLPSDFLSAVHRQLIGLSDPVRRLLDAGAVLGRPFTLHEAAGLLGCRAVDLILPATDAVACELLVDRENELTFRHELIRDACYDALPAPVRLALHREAATVVQHEGRSAMEVAEHLVRCGQPGNDRAKDVLQQAVAELVPTAPGTAADLTLRMLALFDEHDPSRPQLVADAVRLLAAAGRVEQARTLGTQALRSGLDAPSEAALMLGLSEALKHAGHNSSVIEYTGRALAREGVPDSARAQLLAIRAHALWALADFSGAQRSGTEAVEVGAHTGQCAAVVFGTAACSAVCWTAGALDDAVRQARDAVRTADTAGGEAAQRHPRLWLGRALTATDQFAEADAVYEMGQREADQLETAWSWPIWHYFRAELHLAAGRLDDANAEAEAGVRVSEQFATRAVIVPLLALLSQLALQRDDVPTAREQLRRAQALRSAGSEGGDLDLAWRIALLADAQGEPAAAVNALTEIYDGFPHRLQILVQDPLAGAQLVRIARRAGAEAQAKAAASATRLLAQRNPSVDSLVGAAAHAEGLLRGDLAALRRAVHAYRLSPRMLAKATVLEDTAWAEHHAGHHRVAVKLLRTALGHYQSCGAHRDVSRVTRRLHRLGARHEPVKDAPVQSPWDTLTKSELRVVRLIAQGLTNRETASRLFLSPHTVDSHLRHSFTKLGVNSRVELTRHVLTHDRDAD
ncbi:MAG: AAA family ATPase [Pseudonocardiales bacterium]|nr:AAA family ATPase [Pseudonocardiales bacterium]